MATSKKTCKASVVLAISLVVVLLFSCLAMCFNTSWFSVKVERIYFDTDSGTLSGLLYMPKGVDASHPAPTLVTTHGYLNSAEMQDANAIEMSRRGYVVLALDQYDHGHSQANKDHTGGFFSFWPTSQFDAVSYMYQQPYVLKDAEGNGIIAVTGHSMGGFSSENAVALDEAAFEANGYRMIHAILTEGADYQWTAYLGLDTAKADETAGGRFYGKVCAQFDEFFFNNSAVKAPGTVVKKDYVNTPDGLIFLQQTEAGTAEAGKWYSTSDGGQRIVYQPHETHPWNHFSTTTTASLLDFYSVAFADYNSGMKSIPSNNQIWLLKELSECVALIGFIVFLMALAAVLLKVPFLKEAISGKPVVTEPAKSTGSKIAAVAMFIATMLIPAIIFPAMYDGSYTAEAMRWLVYVADIAIVIAVIALIIAIKDGDKKHTIGSVVAGIAAICLRMMTTESALNTKFFGNGQLFKAGVPTSILKWALVCAFISVIISVAAYVFSRKEKSLAQYGIAGSVKTVIASLVLAVVVAVIGFALLFIVDAIFVTDFRIWTFAFKTFEPECISASLVYIPFFFIYYFVASAGAVANTSSKKLQGVWGYVLAALTNMGGILVWLILQYGLLFSKGVALYPGQALSGILLIALVPTLAMAFCWTKFLYKKTGNIWTAAFLNAIVVTIMTIANTTVYWQV